MKYYICIVNNEIGIISDDNREYYCNFKTKRDYFKKIIANDLERVKNKYPTAKIDNLETVISNELPRMLANEIMSFLLDNRLDVYLNGKFPADIQKVTGMWMWMFDYPMTDNALESAKNMRDLIQGEFNESNEA